MHYYKKNIGDYHKKAGRLSMLEHGSYTLLIDACYDREEFPTFEDAINWTWARTDEEISAVKFVLSRFFSLEDGKYIQKDIQEDIRKYHENAVNNARIAREREYKRRNIARSVDKSAPIVHEACTERDEACTERHLTINHKPITNNHKYKNKEKEINKEKEGSPIVVPDWIPTESWNGYLDMRKKNKKSPTLHAITILVNKLSRMRDEGQDIASVLDKSTINGWTDVYPIKSPYRDGGQLATQGKFDPVLYVNKHRVSL